MLWRPAGLLAASQGADHGPPHLAAGGNATDWRRSGPVLAMLGVLGAAAVALMPFWASPGLMFLAGGALIAALFALSWNLLFGTTGLATFGHAAFFAIGAYAAGLALKATGGQWFIAILAATALFGAVVALIVGLIVIRRTAGIALAILTLALSEILRMTISSSPRLGRDEGVSGIPRPMLDLGLGAFGIGPFSLQSTERYFWFLCAVCGLAALLLWWLTLGRFGRMLRAIRQDPERTAFLGIDVARMRLASFVIAGALASLAGALQAPWVQIVTPDIGGYLMSTQPMLSTLLGGAAFFWGPVIGTILFFVLDQLTRSLAGLSETVTGGVLLLLVLLAPDGVLGMIGRWRGARLPPKAATPALALARGEAKAR
jgi:branched-chain amino acid transport system permease protein